MPSTFITVPLLSALAIFFVALVVFQQQQQNPHSPKMAISHSSQSSFSTMTNSNSSSGVGVDLNWYPPSSTLINNLTAVFDDTQGTYGFIYNSSHTPDDQYGVYNWCNMPHVRASEYVPVTPEEEYELLFVEVIQRHHKRTPYSSNSFPVEPYQWNCTDQGLFYYGSPFTSSGEEEDKEEYPAPVQAYWANYISPLNPFTPSGWTGTCQFPQITAPGLDDSYTHGEDLYGVYGDLLHFLPPREAEDGKGQKVWRDQVQYRVTNNVITSQVAGMLIAGTWHTSSSSSSSSAQDIDIVPLLIQAENVDSLEPQYSCPTSDTLFNGAAITTGNSAWDAHLSRASSLYATLDAISGVDPGDSAWHASFDHYFDNLSARQCHDHAVTRAGVRESAKPLPCNATTGDCVTQDMADEVYRLGQWEYSHMYRDAGPATLRASAASFGVWAAELAGHFRAVVSAMTEGGDGEAEWVIEGKRGTKYFHNVAHDGSVSRLLGMLQLDVMAWPGMGSEVVFEVYKKKDRGNHFVRVLFGGQTMRSSNPSLGLMEMVPVETLLAYFDGLTGQGASMVKENCGV